MLSSSAPSAFAYREFRLLTFSRFLFSFAAQLQAVVMGWQVYELMHDPLYLGLIGLTEAVPALTLALFSGYIVDRGNPLWIYRGVIAMSALSALILVLNSLGFLGMNPHLRVAWIYIAAFLTGTGRGFSSPSLYVIIPKLIPREVYTVSAAWVAVAFQMATVIGPATGGVLFAWKGSLTAYSLDLILLLTSFLCVGMIKTDFKRVMIPEREPLREILSSGFRFVFSNQLLISALALDMFAVLFGGVTSILPLFAGDILQIGPRGLGLLRSAPAIGAICMGTYLIRHPITKNAGNILLFVVSGFGLCMIGFGLSTNLYLSLSLLVLSGALDSVSMVIRGSIVQLCSPEAMRGRIAAVNSIFIGSSNELGAFESGVAAKLLGTVASVVFGGSVTLISVIVTYARASKLRKMDLSKL
jgi:MFS family permease